MKKIKENTKLLNKTKNHFFDNDLLNQLNLDVLKNKSHNKSKINKNSQLFSSIKNIQNEKTNNKNNINEINEYKTNTINYQNSNKIKYKSHSNLFTKNKKRKDNIIFRKYLLGNDVVLPIKSIKDFENSNIPFYIFDKSDKMSSLSPIKNNNSKSILNSLIGDKYNHTCANFRSSKKLKNIRVKSFKKKIFFYDKSSKSISSNKNINTRLNLYDAIEENKLSNKNINKIYFKTIQNAKNKENDLFKCKNNNSNFKNMNLANSTSLSNKNKDIPKRNNVENYKKDILDKIAKIKYDKIRKLIDNPNSFLYIMFNKMNKQKFEDTEINNKLYMRKKFEEYKKDLNKLEQKARFELFNLKKERIIGNEINLKGRIISTNTFFDLAFGLKS